MNAPARPALRWHGGKWMLAPWIIGHMPSHRNYVEPFGGAASVLLRKPRSYAEIYNDLDDDVVGLFRVLRDPSLSAQLERQLRHTPFARAEFESAYQEADDQVEKARRLIIRSFMGFGSDACTARSTGFRANSNRSGTTPAHDWLNYPDSVRAFTDRLAGVVIETRNAIDVMTQHDAPNTLHYVDPPYLPETRARRHRKNYRHELTEQDHEALLECLLSLGGLVILSGYPSALYDDCLVGWHRFQRKALADGARERTEVLWTNFPPAQSSLGLFEEVSA